MPDFTAEREAMVERQLIGRRIRSQALLDAFRKVPREAFVDAADVQLAYGDHPLPIAAGQTISQPYIVALMIEAADIGRGDAVLEVGAGSGYAAAVISRIAQTVVAVERLPALVAQAAERMRRLGYDNVRIVEGDGTKGWPKGAPYDAILAAASGSHVPAAFIEQLKPGGAIVMPIGSPDGRQRLIKARKQADGSVRESGLGNVRFVPLIGEDGWSNE